MINYNVLQIVIRYEKVYNRCRWHNNEPAYVYILVFNSQACMLELAAIFVDRSTYTSRFTHSFDHIQDMLGMHRNI